MSGCTGLNPRCTFIRPRRSLKERNPGDRAKAGQQGALKKAHTHTIVNTAICTTATTFSTTKYLVMCSIYTDGLKQLSRDVASRSDITPCNKIDKPLVVYRFNSIMCTQ